MVPYRVYLDTTILKFSASKLERLIPRQQKINWGGVDHEITVHDFVDINPVEKKDDPKLKADAKLLEKIATLGKQGYFKFLIQIETLFESWGLPSMDSQSGIFYGAHLQHVDAPIDYSRLLFDGNENSKEMQIDFMLSINNKRFTELQKMTGAYQGLNKINSNQLLDAFHIWCAEGCGSDYFLTMDYKLIKHIKNNKKHNTKVELVSPSQLLRVINDST